MRRWAPSGATITRGGYGFINLGERVRAAEVAVSRRRLDGRRVKEVEEVSSSAALVEKIQC